MEGWLRPYVRFVQGTPGKMKFNRKKGVFSFLYQSDPEITLPTEIYIPKLQYPKGYQVTITGGDLAMIRAEGDSLLRMTASESKEFLVLITRK